MKKLTNAGKRLAFCFAMTLGLSVAAPEILTSAAAMTTSTCELRYVNGDGVRLRKEGWTGGTILELMYDGEKIWYYDILGSDVEYNYVQRIKTTTYGYVDHHYTRTYE